MYGGCNKYEETGEEIMRCTDLGENEENITYNWFFEDVSAQVKAAKILMKKFKIREKLTEEETCEKMKNQDGPGPQSAQ